MRELKFRAYVDNRFIYFTLFSLLKEQTLFVIREVLIPWLRNGGKPQEFIGLNDKNGKEIYEGDIIRLIGKNNKIEFIDVVEYRVDNQVGYSPFLDMEYGVFTILTDYDVFVIGNIYENPELLKGEK